MCPRSSDPFYIVTNSWTYVISTLSLRLRILILYSNFEIGAQDCSHKSVFFLNAFTTCSELPSNRSTMSCIHTPIKPLETIRCCFIGIVSTATFIHYFLQVFAPKKMFLGILINSTICPMNLWTYCVHLITVI